MVYLQNRHFSENKATLVESKKTPYHLQPADILSVQIKSSAEKEVSGMFNISTQNLMVASPGTLFLEGYSIDASGKITLPILGELIVKDLTVEEAQQFIQLSANKYFNNAIVIVKLISFKVTVLGEVKSPGYYYVYNNQATALEALGMAGDLTNFGNRRNIKLLRQKDSGTEVILLDLTNPDLLKSEYFFLKPGDVLYVEPLKARSKRSNLELLSVVFAATTTAVLIFSYVNTKK
ncbi:MAG: polysaccharide biosynthesis/export family protein [Bacteroidetes bacterium]|nr:polysaccharide biosynthesis/export family protein [Bacteroidota bacterium]